MIRESSVFIKRKFREKFKSVINKRDIALLKDKNFVIISNNCWGGTAYQWYERPYNSPFVGLFLYGPCYLKLLNNFEYYMTQELEFVSSSFYPDRELTYPLAKLDDVEIHFTHYETEEEAKEKWKRRTERMLQETNLDNYYFKICDRERTTKEHLLEFHQLPFKNKLSFSIKDHKELRGKRHIKVLESHKKNKKYVPNGKKMFKLTFLYFNLNNWLLT
ncbi:DUF1919 domain-containing protein [Aestuariibaculum suncheonense]|uniref:DUF1919 domain-containing protein n=1 Tax=Aestuariibaculum suncheonense TaxID=1028745 RepID=A0A8J6QCM5_9FLAO|nr:DUF1919 domain-containing protein [Aestuariibaculum suncheonense]MBD0834918.1 DUF1919 domain-containing protein [Aestuariibaculum suncheonense]